MKTKKTWIVVSLVFLQIFTSITFISCSSNKKTADKSKSTNKSSQDKEDKEKASTELAFDQPEATQDPFNDASGPFYHNVYEATSEDGLDFTKEEGVILKKASVPDIVKMPDGRLVIYAVDGGMRSRSGFLVAISDDDGATWKQGSLQMKASGGPMAGADPEAIILPNGKIRLYYMVAPMRNPTPNSPAPIGEKVKIKSALSEDGINFEEEEGSRYESTEFTTDPDVIKIGDKWYMYLSLGPKLIVVTSDDGLNFESERTIREKGSVSNTVPIEEGKYRQYFMDSGIKSAVSVDGLSWQNDSGYRIEETSGKTVGDPAPIKVGEEWLMFYKVNEGKNSIGE